MTGLCLPKMEKMLVLASEKDASFIALQRSNEVKITERAVRLELSLQHRPDAILNLGGLF